MLTQLNKLSQYADFAVIKNPDEKLYSEGYESLIVAVFPYYGGQKSGLFSVYCQIKDYHIVIKEIFDEILSPLDIPYKAFVDLSPFSEKELAEMVGLGSIGKNGLLLTEKYSSLVFIGEAAIKAQIPEISYNKKNICIDCQKCVNACPTGALSDGKFDKEKCLSALTQKKALTAENEENLKKASCIFGCDICQFVCPVTEKSLKKESSAFSKLKLDLTEEKILNMSDEFFNENYKEFAFSWRKLEILKRNINICQPKN